MVLLTRRMHTTPGQSTVQPVALSRVFGPLDWRAGRALPWQLFGVVVVWAYLIALHVQNDGLWFQGDAPRHLANGLFWLDLLKELPSDPKQFALAYYARYPVIHPTAHPPGFYVIEAVTFALFGASPFVAKALVLLFALMAAIYLTLWLRRWVAPEAGWAAGLLLVQPSVILWSHTVMLNTPSMAIGLGALWHMRRWLESPRSRHVYPAMILTVAGILTYATTGVVVLIFVGWVIAGRHWAVLKDRRAWLLAPVLLLVLIPWVMVITRWAPLHLASVYDSQRPVWFLQRWTYYVEALPVLFTPLLLGLAALGTVVGLADRSLRRETTRVVIWSLVCYAAFSYVVSRDQRYVMLLGPAAVALTTIGLWSLARRTAPRLSAKPAVIFFAAVAVVTGVHLWIAAFSRMPRATGFKEVAAYFTEMSPDEPVFYDGRYDGIFSFYMRVNDPGFKRGVVLGHKLLYASAIFPEWRLKEFVSSPEDVVQRIQSECGCRWLAIEQSPGMDKVAADRYLREAVRGPEFQFVKTFTMDATLPLSIDVYRFLLPIKSRDEIELNFPYLGEGTKFRVKPIQR
jgi:dolichyl-phosphate-mannose-protein mannosyltransferase